MYKSKMRKTSPLFPMSYQLIPHRVLNVFPESSQCVPNTFPEVKKEAPQMLF
jgi:hypothetical protein